MQSWQVAKRRSSLAPARGCDVADGLRCRTTGCQREVVPSLQAHGVCLGHYLDMVYARMDSALDLCQRGAPVDPRAFEWLLSQGDFAARALQKGGEATDLVERTRLLELLLCLANLHEYAAHHSIKVTSATAPGHGAQVS